MKGPKLLLEIQEFYSICILVKFLGAQVQKGASKNFATFGNSEIPIMEF